MNETEKKKPTLTARQKEIYEFLKDKILNRGYGPTVREIGNHFGIRSPNGVMCHLKALEKKGLITRESHMSRAIQLTDAPQYRLTLKDAGRISVGHPLIPSNNGERVNFASLFDAEDNRCLQVEGNHLVGQQINDGDYLVVNIDREAMSGDLVVLGGHGKAATVRRYSEVDGQPTLESVDNPSDCIQASGCEKYGVVVSVIRQY